MTVDEPTRRLEIPILESQRHIKNYIRVAVCEVRFPVVLEIEERCPPRFQKALRKKYPGFGKGQGFNITDSGASLGGASYTMQSRDSAWTVTIAPNRLSLETNAYSVFEDFEVRLKELIEEAMPDLDTDFFTRIGLRYVNAVPLPTNEREALIQWINPILASPLSSNAFGTISAFTCEIRGKSMAGNYTFRYGLPEGGIVKDKGPEFMLDFDHFEENVEAVELINLTREFRKINYSFFRWALGPAAEANLLVK